MVLYDYRACCLLEDVTWFVMIGQVSEEIEEDGREKMSY
jgi:hypothetical protein